MQLGSHMVDEVWLDGMCLAILQDKETDAHVDYFYVADLWAPDPRYKSRNMRVGQSYGLFRIQKRTLEAELLYLANGDESKKCFFKAASKIIREYRAAGVWLQKSQYAAG